MNFERKSDMLAWQWAREDSDFELMLSFEPGNWALPIAIGYHSHGGDFHGYTVISRVRTLRLFCAALYFSSDRTTLSATHQAEEEADKLLVEKIIARRG